ncbi:MAG: DUF192 domain-containing protein [Xanthomonadales bacterium]
MIPLVLACVSCMAREPHVVLNGEAFSVELAETRDKQTLGLMFRDELPDDHGMLFLFPVEAMRSFWMKNTRIPLDIFYFDEELRLINVQTARPCRVRNCPVYPSTAPAKYVLELNAGKAEELGAQPGDRLELHLD